MKKPSLEKLYPLLYICFFFIGAVTPSTLYALSVGDITLHSRLGDPLKATLPISHSEQLSNEQVIVRMAPVEIYDQFGLERLSTIDNLVITLDENQTVILSTRAPIKEPFLNFVLEFVWPDGQVYREFRLLLDP